MNIAQVVQFISALVWLLAIGLAILFGVRASRKQSVKGFTSGVVIMFLIAIGLTTVGAGLVFIEPDEMAVVITAGQGGIRPDPLTAGIHWIIPFIERVETYTILRQTYTMATAATEGQVAGDDAIQVRTRDGQQVYIDATVIYSIDPNKAVDLYRTWLKNYEDGLVRPQSRGVIRDVSSQYGVEEIVSAKRAELEQQITVQLTEIFSKNDLILHDFVLRNIRFSDEYAAAVEQKQIAEQQAQQAKFVVESKRQEAEQARQIALGQADAAVITARGAAEARIAQAEAEAKSLQLVANVLKDNPALLQYQYITNLAPNVRTMLLPSNAPFILPQIPK